MPSEDAEHRAQLANADARLVHVLVVAHAAGHRQPQFQSLWRTCGMQPAQRGQDGQQRT